MIRKLWVFLFIVWMMTACAPTPTETPRETPTRAAAAATSSIAAPSSTPAPPREMTLCLGSEPNTLYPYGGPNAAARSLLAAIFPSPVQIREYQLEPGILQKIPSLGDGDAVLAPVYVSSGDEIVDADGTPVTLARGTRIRPSGCYQDSCALTYDGRAAIEMDAMTVTFRLRANLRWSDGEPLTADDSIYAFDLLSEEKTPASKFLIERTETYEAIDPLTVQWRGKPGYVDAFYATHFFAPMPMHAWGKFSASELLHEDASTRYPTGWGAYVVQEWTPGEEIRLVKNPLYFRAEEDLPLMDAITFRFYPNPNEAVAALLAGECDALSPNIPLGGQAALLKELAARGEIQLVSAPAPAIEWLVFGIRPASYDDGFINGTDRPNLLGDARTRRALAACIDRETAQKTALMGFAEIPDSFVPAESPFYDSALPAYVYAPEEAAQQLENLGWRDLDGNPETPRVAYGVQGVPNGTPLTLTYLATTSTQRRQVSEIFAQSLRACGVGMTLEYLPPEEFFAPGPDGALFGRKFDLAEFSLAPETSLPPCEWFTSEAIPSAENHWEGLNVSGYQNSRYDAACRAAKNSLEGKQAYWEAQEIFAEDLPALPLFTQTILAAARNDFCGYAPDAFAGAFWNIESLGVGEACAP